MIYTAGYSNTSTHVFNEMLREYKIDAYVDVRHFPRSRQRPEFNSDVIGDWLAVEYINLSELLGGKRAKQKGVDPELNAGWQNASFKNYADYTLSDSYHEGIEILDSLAKEKTIVFCCCEAVPWRCHRSLIANTLVMEKSREVGNLISGRVVPHRANGFGAHAVIENGHVYYPRGRE